MNHSCLTLFFRTSGNSSHKRQFYYWDHSENSNKTPKKLKTNRFKGLDLIECLKNHGQRFVTVYRKQWLRPFPRKRNAKRQNGCLNRWDEKRREAKGKGEKERYTHLNAEFQRIAKKDKKVFLSDQCKEIEENNRMGKARDLFKKIRDAKGTFHAKMGTKRTEMIWT